MQRFEGKTVLITGSARGIGQGIALCLAEEGADIVVNDLPPGAGPNIHDAKGTAEAVEKLGRRALVQYADVSDRAQVERMFAAVVDHFGHLDVVVANAARTVREPVVEAKWENVLATLEVTQFGVFHTCQLAAQQMLRQIEQGRPGGKIIIISSVLSVVPLVTSASYNMAKAGIIQFGRTLANELAEYHINVNVINPGWIDTPGEHLLASDEEIREGAKHLPWKRLGTPRDIGLAVAYLASADADYVTGSVLNVDGGYTLGLR